MSHVIGRTPVLTVNRKGIITDAAEANLFAGDVDGPAGATPGNLAVFADATGQAIMDGGAPGTVNWRGPWVGGSPGYDLDDLVSHNGSSWIATAPTTDEPGVGSPNDWDLVAQKGDDGAAGTDGADGAPGPPGIGTWRGAWQAGSPGYVPDDLVQHEGSTWFALRYTTQEPGTAVGSPSDWDLVAAKGMGTWRGPWSPLSPGYLEGDLVEYLGSSYIATADTADTPGTSPSDWDLVAAKGDTGSGGNVDSVTSAGSPSRIQVDNTDPANPVVEWLGAVHDGTLTGDGTDGSPLGAVTLVGDTGSGGVKGIAPAPASGDAAAGKFLKADATWQVPPGGSSGVLVAVVNITDAEYRTLNATPKQILAAPGSDKVHVITGYAIAADITGAFSANVSINLRYTTGALTAGLVAIGMGAAGTGKKYAHNNNAPTALAGTVGYDNNAVEAFNSAGVTGGTTRGGFNLIIWYVTLTIP